MQQAWDDVNTVLTQMAPFLKRTAMAESQYRMPAGDITQITIDKYNEVFDFLCLLDLSEQWEAVKKAWNLCPPERWQWYDDYDCTDFQEQGILNTACSAFARLWRDNKPTGFFGRQIDEQNFEDSA